MDERTLAALKGSIAKWEAIVADEGEDSGPNNCPLCQLFHPAHGGKGNPVDCGGCPVREATGQMGCGGTPYDTYEVLTVDGDDDDVEAIAAAAQEELEFLRSLLPADEVAETSHESGAAK